MTVRADILERISKTRNGAAETVLAQALALATVQEQRPIVDILIQRGQRGGWIALIRYFDRLSDEDRARILAQPRELFGPLAEVMGDATGNGRENAIRIMRESADPKLVTLLTDALTDPRPEVRELAGQTLLDAVRRFRTGGWENWATDLPEIQRAVEVALRGFKAHRQQSALMAAFIFERQLDSPMWTIFNDQYAEATKAGNIILRQLADPSLASGAFLALGSALKVAALTGIAGCDQPAVIEALLREAYRLTDPKLRAAVEGIANFKLFAEGRREVRWEKDNPLGWLRLIEGLNLAEHIRLGLIKRMLDTLGDGAGVVVKIMALRILGQIQVPEVLPVLTAMTHDTDVRIARTATRYIVKRRQSDWRAYAPEILKSRHDAVRRLAGTVSSGPVTTSGQFDALWHGYHKLPPALQHNTTRTAATNDVQFDGQLRAKLAGTVADITQGLRMIASLKNIAPYRERIIALCAHADNRVVSAAIKLIGRMEDPRLRDLLEAATQHSDTRVRANAIEAMETLKVAHTSKQVLAMITSRHNRERANAIKALGKFDIAMAQDCLLKMLADPNPLHRISALWVVSQLDMLEVIRYVGVMARKDNNMKVRNRAEELLQTLHAVTAPA